jgi:hypothetical protein
MLLEPGAELGRLLEEDRFLGHSLMMPTSPLSDWRDYSGRHQQWRLGRTAPRSGRERRVPQIGVTALGADSVTKLYAGFTWIPVEREWLAGAIQVLCGEAECR